MDRTWPLRARRKRSAKGDTAEDIRLLATANYGAPRAATGNYAFAGDVFKGIINKNKMTKMR
jgi:hypothetical protein